MIRLFLLSAILFLSACSFKTPENKWQYNSANYFQLYTNNFLNANTVLAKNDLKVSISNAKRSADLTTLAKVYLGKCALDISVGIDTECKEFDEVTTIVHDKRLDVYYKFITKSEPLKEKVILLPDDYIDFEKAVEKQDYKEAKTELFNMEKTTSKLLASALIKEHMDRESIQKVLALASFHGYKKVVLFWLEESKKYANEDELHMIEKKINILTKEK